MSSLYLYSLLFIFVNELGVLIVFVTTPGFIGNVAHIQIFYLPFGHFFTLLYLQNFQNFLYVAKNIVNFYFSCNPFRRCQKSNNTYFYYLLLLLLIFFNKSIDFIVSDFIWMFHICRCSGLYSYLSFFYCFSAENLLFKELRLWHTLFFSWFHFLRLLDILILLFLL